MIRISAFQFIFIVLVCFNKVFGRKTFGNCLKSRLKKFSETADGTLLKSVSQAERNRKCQPKDHSLAACLSEVIDYSRRLNADPCNKTDASAPRPHVLLSLPHLRLSTLSTVPSGSPHPLTTMTRPHLSKQSTLSDLAFCHYRYRLSSLPQYRENNVFQNHFEVSSTRAS